jgi:hypothetical protein
MDAVGGPDAKKARWSPTSAYATQNNGSALSNNSSRDAFANYGYGPQASIAQPFNAAPGPTANGGGFASSPLYSTPSLSINTPTNGVMNPQQLSPNTVAALQMQQQQQNQAQAQQQQAQGSPNGNYNAFNAYSMLGMGMPGMGMLGAFPYNGQMGNFGQVRLHSAYSPNNVFLFYDTENALPQPQHAEWSKCRRLFPRRTQCCHECF